MATCLLPLVSGSIFRGLQDSDDDVRAVAARALLPVADQLHCSFQDKVRLTYSSVVCEMSSLVSTASTNIVGQSPSTG